MRNSVHSASACSAGESRWAVIWRWMRWRIVWSIAARARSVVSVVDRKHAAIMSVVACATSGASATVMLSRPRHQRAHVVGEQAAHAAVPRRMRPCRSPGAGKAWSSVSRGTTMATVPMSRLGDVRLGEIEDLHVAAQQCAPGRRPRRPGRPSRRVARGSGRDHYLVQLYATGGLVGEAGDQGRVLQGGDVQILDLTQSNVTQAAPSGTVAIVVPRETLDQACRRRATCTA